MAVRGGSGGVDWRYRELRGRRPKENRVQVRKNA